MQTPRRTLSAITTALVMATVACTSSDEQPSGKQSSGSESAESSQPSESGSPDGRKPLAWSDCGGGLQCATMSVPLAAGSDSRQIDVGLARSPATAQSQGVLVMNPGTQSGGGVALLKASAPLFSRLNRDYDIVAMDTRGTGTSAPVAKCTTYAENRRFEEPLPADQTTADRAQRIREARLIDAACSKRSKGILPYLSSWASAADLESLRAALGEDKLTLLGMSSGTVLMQAYLARYPDHVERVVLDSPFDAEEYASRPFDFDIDQMKATEHTIGTFFEWCADAGKQCRFGNGSPRRAFEQLMAKTRKNRLENPGDWSVMTDGALVDFIGGAMLFPDQWPKVAGQLAAMVKAPVPKAPLPRGFDLTYAAYYSQSCLDRDFPNDLAAFDSQLRDAKRAAPILGGRYGYAEFKCFEWPVEADQSVEWGNPDNVPVLVLRGTDDPQAPSSGARKLAQRLNASAVTVHGSGHLQSGRSACVDRATLRFLSGEDDITAQCSISLPPAG